MVTLPTKREVLESILDKEDELWIIMKPSRNDPTDSDSLCIFQNPAQHKEARVEIPIGWFTDKEFDKIESTVLDAIEHAEFGYKYT
jgi:hypothetical protein